MSVFYCILLSIVIFSVNPFGWSVSGKGKANTLFAILMMVLAIWRYPSMESAVFTGAMLLFAVKGLSEERVNG